jgi:hypothetical protein
MRRAIDLNDEFAAAAGEVREIGADGVLSQEAVSLELVVLQF